MDFVDDQVLKLFEKHLYPCRLKVTMADMNWASAELMAEVDKIILEKGYGCEVELIAGAA